MEPLDFSSNPLLDQSNPMESGILIPQNYSHAKTLLQNMNVSSHSSLQHSPAGNIYMQANPVVNSLIFPDTILQHNSSSLNHLTERFNASKSKDSIQTTLDSPVGVHYQHLQTSTTVGSVPDTSNSLWMSRTENDNSSSSGSQDAKKLSAQQLRLQRETEEERERRLSAGRERMRQYRERAKLIETEEERERRLAIARERTKLGRSLETLEQREKRLKKTRERLKERRQGETPADGEKKSRQRKAKSRPLLVETTLMESRGPNPQNYSQAAALLQNVNVSSHSSLQNPSASNAYMPTHSAVNNLLFPENVLAHNPPLSLAHLTHRFSAIKSEELNNQLAQVNSTNGIQYPQHLQGAAGVSATSDADSSLWMNRIENDSCSSSGSLDSKKLSAQQLRLQRETPEERDRRLFAGRERMRLYRERERLMETPEDKERRLAVARERTRLGRSLESPEQRERRLKKTRERLRLRRQLESPEQRENRLKKHRESKRDRYHKMTPEERSMLRHTSGKKRSSSPNGSSSFSEGDVSQDPKRYSRPLDGKFHNSYNNEWDSAVMSLQYGLNVKIEADDCDTAGDSAAHQHMASTTAVSQASVAAASMQKRHTAVSSAHSTSHTSATHTVTAGHTDIQAHASSGQAAAHGSFGQAAAFVHASLAHSAAHAHNSSIHNVAQGAAGQAAAHAHSNSVHGSVHTHGISSASQAAAHALVTSAAHTSEPLQYSTLTNVITAPSAGSIATAINTQAASFNSHLQHFSSSLIHAIRPVTTPLGHMAPVAAEQNKAVGAAAACFRTLPCNPPVYQPADASSFLGLHYKDVMSLQR